MDIYIERIKPLFKNSGLSNIQLEKVIGLPRSIIYDWDNGRSKSYKKYADKIAQYFGISTDYILGKENTKHEFPQQDIEKTRRIENLFAEKGLPFDDKTVSLFLDFVAANAEIIKRQMGKNK